MPCCKAEKYDWCKDLPVVDYKDEEGKEYCVFHAPKGEKGISTEEFNGLVFERINLAKKGAQSYDLSGTIFEWDISFYKFDAFNPLPPIDFIEATFSGKADFSGVTFNELASFRGATFNGEAGFRGATFNGLAGFGVKEFSEGANFEDLRIKEKILFESSDLKEAIFVGTDLRKMDFFNCTWPKKIGRDVLYDEIRIFGEDWEPNSRFFEEAIKAVEILYRMLKQKYKEEHNEYEVSNWHYGEKEMFRKGSCFRRFFPLSLSNLYWLSSGYGERPVRAGIVLISLIFILSVLTGMSGFKPPEGGFAAIILNTLQYATLQKATLPEPASLTGAYFKLLTQILIPLQTALLALAVKNRFKR